VSELVTKLNKQKPLNITYKKFAGADHFFAKDLEKIQTTVKKYVQNTM